MEFHPHPDETRRIGAPRDWDPEKHGECGALSVADVTGEGGLACMESLWRPEAADLAAIAAGGALALGVTGGPPFVSLTVASAEQEFPLVGGERLTLEQMGGELAMGIGRAPDGTFYPFFQRVVAGGGGIRFHESVWPLDDETRAAIAEGALIALAIGGNVHPVVYLGVTLPPQHDGTAG